MKLPTCRNINIEKDAKDLYELIILYKCNYPILSELFDESLESFKNKISQKLVTNYINFKLIFQEHSMVGFMFAYDYKVVDCHMKFIICLPECTWNNDFSQLCIQYLHSLFSYYNIRKIYIESCCNYHTKKVSFYKQQGFHIETILKKYYFNSGVYYDHIYFSIDYSKFYSINKNKLTSYI